MNNFWNQPFPSCVMRNIRAFVWAVLIGFFILALLMVTPGGLQ